MLWKAKLSPTSTNNSKVLLEMLHSGCIYESACKDEYNPNEFVIVCLSLLSEAEHMCMKSNPRWEQLGCVWVKYCSESIKTLQGLIP